MPKMVRQTEPFVINVFKDEKLTQKIVQMKDGVVIEAA